MHPKSINIWFFSWFTITFPSLSHHFPIGILEEASVDWNGSEVIL
jgi:hypothetical protein